MKTRLCLIIALSLIIAPITVTPFTVSAQDARSKQSGLIDLKVDSTEKNPYKDAESQAIAHMKALEAKINDLENGNVSPITRPSDAAVHHLTGIYLFCTLRKGTCPAPLDALLETDLIDSRIAKKAECPTLLTFWRDWQSNDMEQRQKFLTRIGNFSATSEFSRRERPRYIKCQETIAGLTNAPGADADFFKSRYNSAPGQLSASEAAVKATLDLLEEARTSIPDIFTAIDNMKQ